MTFIAPRFALLLGAAFIAPIAADAQQAEAPAPPAVPAASQPVPEPIDEEEEADIVVTGQRARGSVIGDIPPEKSLDSRDIRATGATSIGELLDALAPEIGSARGRGGGQPVLLLNGQRISSFRELRDIPPEAIQRVDILPEEVALKYGYRADQRVVNIVLRPRFRSTAAHFAGTGATEGGYLGGNGDLTRMMIGRAGRTTINLRAEGNGLLTESERDVEGTTADEQSARSLIGSRRLIRGSTTFNRTILGNVSATLNTDLEHNKSRSLLGLSDTLDTALARRSTSTSAHAGMTLSGDQAGWRWNVTGNADWDRDRTVADDKGDEPGDRTRQTTTSADVTGTANGNLFKLPAGNAGATLTLAGSTVQLDGEREHLGVETETSLGRTAGRAAANLDLPVSRRNRDFSALGNLTVNANAELEQLSDFGSLATIGAGASWSPAERLNFIASWTREEGAPTIQQLGAPILETPDARVFDFTTGETVLATVITGGNPELQGDRRNVVKLGANWQPFPKTDLRLRADYVRSVIDQPVQNIFGPTPALEEAFPERFVRDSSGNLVSVDLRPLNFDQARRDTLRIGFDFSRPLRSRRPSQSFIDQMRSQFGRGARGAAPGGARPEGGSPPEDAVIIREPPPGADSAGRGEHRGFGGGGGFFGGGNRGRLQFSLTDTITFVDKVSIGPGLPDLDYLRGEAAGVTGGTPRHNVQAQAGWANNGLGARVGANWRSGTRVNGLGGDELRFSPLATFDLRLFANLGEQFELVAKHPWLRGSSMRFEVRNLLDATPRVRDASGNTPLNYQPDLLDPLGRTIMISFRKLFLPPPRFFQRQRPQQDQAPQPPSR